MGGLGTHGRQARKVLEWAAGNGCNLLLKQCLHVVPAVVYLPVTAPVQAPLPGVTSGSQGFQVEPAGAHGRAPVVRTGEWTREGEQRIWDSIFQANHALQQGFERIE